MFRKTALAATAAVVALTTASFAAPATAVTVNEGLVYSIDARVQYQMSKGDTSILHDLSGFNQDGELIGSGVKVTKKHRVISFNSNGGYGLSLERHNFQHGITVEARVDLGKMNAWERIFDFGNGAEADNIVMAREGYSNEIRLDLYQGGYKYGAIYTTNGPLAGKTGLHTFTFVASDEFEPALYIDGVYAPTTSVDWDAPFYIAPFSVARSSSYVGISNWEGGGDDRLEGKIQYLRVYNYGLDEDTIFEHATTNSKWDSLGW